MKSDVNWSFSGHCVVHLHMDTVMKNHLPAQLTFLFMSVSPPLGEVPLGRDFVQVSFVFTNLCWIQGLIPTMEVNKILLNVLLTLKSISFCKRETGLLQPSGYSWCLIGRWASA